jgi:hypothetical protein
MKCDICNVISFATINLYLLYTDIKAKEVEN